LAPRLILPSRSTVPTPNQPFLDLNEINFFRAKKVTFFFFEGGENISKNFLRYRSQTRCFHCEMKISNGNVTTFGIANVTSFVCDANFCLCKQISSGWKQRKKRARMFHQTCKLEGAYIEFFTDSHILLWKQLNVITLVTLITITCDIN